MCTAALCAVVLSSCCKPQTADLHAGTCASEPAQSQVTSPAFPHFDEKGFITLSPGQSVILAGGQTALVPYGTTVIFPSPPGGGVNLFGQKNTVHAAPGTIVTVPVNAVGPADNIVIAKPIPFPPDSKPNQSSQHNASSGHAGCFAPTMPATRVAGS